MGGQEVSAYIDLADRLAHEDFIPYFARKKKLLPRKSDLSYYNWSINSCRCNDTPNFQVQIMEDATLSFKNKRDRKVIIVDPNGFTNCEREEVECEEYVQVIFFDHTTRRKY